MNKELSKAWLLSALADLKTMEHLLEDEFLAHVVAFHGQQCVEKSFKAILENAHKRVPKDHSTLRLYGLIKSHVNLDIDIEILTDFDDLYLNARYPGEFGLLPHGAPSREEAEEFYETARDIFYSICKELNIYFQK